MAMNKYYMSKMTGEVVFNHREAMELYRAGHEIEIHYWSETLQEDVCGAEWVHGD